VRTLIVIGLLMVPWGIIHYVPVTPPEEADIVVYTNTSCECFYLLCTDSRVVVNDLVKK
jgi:hypothetical protein